MMKVKKYSRIIALLLAVVTVFTVPVSALSDDSFYFNVLDFATVNNSGDNFIKLESNGSCNFSWGFQVSVYYVDIVLSIIGDVPSAVYIDTYSSSFPLNIDKIGGYMYRIYGSVDSGSYFSSLNIRFDSSGVSFLTFSQFRIKTVSAFSFQDTTKLYTVFNGVEKSFSGLSDGTLVSVYDPDDGYVEAAVKQYKAEMSFPNWKKYDFWELSFTCELNAIQSISAVLNETSIPFDMSFVDEAGLYSTYEDVSPTVSGGHVLWHALQSEGYVNVNLRFDLRNLDKSSSFIPLVTVNGLGNAHYGCYFNVYASCGSLLPESVDPYIYWFRSLFEQQISQYNNDILIKNVISSGFSSVLSSFVSLENVIVAEFLAHTQAMEDALYDMYELMIQQFDNMVTFLTDMFIGVTDRLDKLIGGTTEGDELSQGAADLEDQVGDIHDFEQSQQAVLDNNFDAIQGAVTFTGFTAALAFVQRYINLSWAGIQGFSVSYTLPIFIGLFFFVCGRIPGATRWRSRPPKDGGSA